MVFIGLLSRACEAQINRIMLVRRQTSGWMRKRVSVPFLNFERTGPLSLAAAHPGILSTPD